MKQMTTSHSETISAQFEIKQTQFCGSYFIQIFFWGGEGGGGEYKSNFRGDKFALLYIKLLVSTLYGAH